MSCGYEHVPKRRAVFYLLKRIFPRRRETGLIWLPVSLSLSTYGFHSSMAYCMFAASRATVTWGGKTVLQKKSATSTPVYANDFLIPVGFLCF